MRFTRFFTIVICLCLSMSLTPMLWAGQVVTKDARLWASKVIQEEKALETIRGQNTLAILYFINKTESADLDPLQKGLALMLITDLSTVEGLQVVERVKLQALTEEMGLGVSGLVEPGTAPRVGKILGAEWLLGGDILGSGPAALRVQSSLLDVPVSTMIGHQSAEGGLSELFRMEKDLLFEIIDVLEIELTPEQKAALRQPCSTNEKALVYFFRGINASDEGDYERAAELYEKALQNDPGICGVKPAINELQVLGLLSVKNKSSDLVRTLKGRISLTDRLTAGDAVKRVKGPQDVSTPVTIDIQFQ